MGFSAVVGVIRLTSVELPSKANEAARKRQLVILGDQATGSGVLEPALDRWG
jgi:hypothetical protein